MRWALLALILIAGGSSMAAAGQGGEVSPDQAIARAAAFLAKEVPAWPSQNRCYSCHNNGDAFRALHLAAEAAGDHVPAVPTKSLTDTAAWLRKPDGWKDNGGEEEFSDKRLANVQFAVALAQLERAHGAKANQEARPLLAAAQLVVEQQGENGSWPIDAAGSVGSPVTYGTPLATVMARAVLHQADPKRFQEAIANADRWLAAFRPQRVFDAATLLLWLTDPAAPAASTDDAKLHRDLQLAECVKMIRQGQSEDGGWGPFATSAPEPFDTALVLLALQRLGPDGYRVAVAPATANAGEPAPKVEAAQDWAQMIECGRNYLTATQYDDGSWPETTRPAGGESYAQRMSTTAWATMALIETR